MSNTTRGGKPAGYEYWSKRPNMNGATGKVAKQLIHRLERKTGDRELKKELKRGNEE